MSALRLALQELQGFVTRGVSAVASAASGLPVLIAASLGGCTRLAPIPEVRLELRACLILELREVGRCGTYHVFEDRARHAGRVIGLRVLVLPARGTHPAPDPVVLFTGGPGLGAAEGVRYAAAMLAGLRDARDVILVDQRGTGQSNPLGCELYGASGRLQPYLDPSFPADAVLACRDRLAARADLTQYTTAIAADDMADLLTALGVPRANLFGASYGSRVALVFLRRHPSRVRSAVIEGVVGPNLIIPLAAARGAEHALDDAFTACAADSLCHANTPDPAGDLRSVMARLRAVPARATLWNWGRLRHETVTITARGFAERAFSMIYDPSGTRRLLGLMHAAAAGDWDPFARAAIGDSRRRKADRSVGMMLSVLCTEDAPRLARADTARIGRAGPLGLPMAHEILSACAGWPHGALAPEDTAPVASTVPVLLISGADDPIAPPDWADSARILLPASVHYIEANAGHAVLDAYTTELTARFIERGRAPATRP